MIESPNSWTPARIMREIKIITPPDHPWRKMPAEYFAPMVPFKNESTKADYQRRAMMWMERNCPEVVVGFYLSVQMGILSKDYRAMRMEQKLIELGVDIDAFWKEIYED